MGPSNNWFIDKLKGVWVKGVNRLFYFDVPLLSFYTWHCLPPQGVVIGFIKEVTHNLREFVCLMVFNVTFNNISVISRRSVLLVEEAGEPRENHRSVARHWQTLSHNVEHLPLIEIGTHNISGDRHWVIA